MNPDAGLPPRSTTSTAAYDLGKYLTSLGNGSIALTSGAKRVFELWDEIGRQRIQEHGVGLASYLKELVAERCSALNVIVAAVLTVAFRAAKAPTSPDETQPGDYFADAGDPRVKKLPSPTEPAGTANQPGMVSTTD